VGVAVAVWVGVAVGVFVGVGVGVFVGVGVAVGVLVGVFVGVAAAGHGKPVIVSIRTPIPALLLSVAIRHLSWMLCPLAAAGRLTVVVMYPPELPVHAMRPAIGLMNCVLIIAEYPPVGKLPPAARMS
jgi:hypothetical protein